MEGESKTYFQSGKIKSLDIYKGGKKNGICFIYDENGLILSEVNYKNGEKID